MRRFLTLVCLLCLAIPAGISISGCTRNPAGNYCNGLGYGLKNTDVASITCSRRPPASRIAFGQTQQVQSPRPPRPARAPAASVSSYTYGTTNNQLVDISPIGQHLRRHVEPQHRRRHCQLHVLQLPQSAAHRQVACPMAGLHHGSGELGDFESGGGLCSSAAQFHISGGAAVVSFARGRGAA